MGVVVASCSIAELFANQPIKTSDGQTIQGFLHLPEYQRSYCWQTSQLQRLLTDLRRHFTQPPPHKFYLGSIILHQEQREHETRLNIIDGQQRLTTMGLLAWLQNPGSEPKLSYTSLESQKQIIANLADLKQQYSSDLDWLDTESINITLVVTCSEDDAYRFFETQNTGGVRLTGPDIIKAHHLRATTRNQQDDYARLWESLGELQPLVDIILKARYWQYKLDFRQLPSYRETSKVRDVVVTELAENTTSEQSAKDFLYQQIRITRTAIGTIQETFAGGYAMRQPLNAGINTINYLHYFHSLYHRLLNSKSDPEFTDFDDFYKRLICKVDGCGFLKKLFDSCLLYYVSCFGSEQLFEASLWLFRVVYSPRVINKVSVKEKTVPAFVQDNPVLDWIQMSYNHSQCIERLSVYSYSATPDNLENERSIKKRFVNDVFNWFNITLQESNLAESYDTEIRNAISLKLKKREVRYGR